MNFEEQKQEIIDVLNERSGEIEYSLYSLLFDKISELNPDYQTCSTCTKLRCQEKRDPLAYHVDYVKFYSCELLGDLGYISPDAFGCNQHSELEIR